MESGCKGWVQTPSGVLPECFEPLLPWRADGVARGPPRDFPGSPLRVRHGPSDGWARRLPSRLPRCRGVAPSSCCVDRPRPPGGSSLQERTASAPTVTTVSRGCANSVRLSLPANAAWPTLPGRFWSTDAAGPTLAGYAIRLDKEQEALMGCARWRRAPVFSSGASTAKTTPLRSLAGGAPRSLQPGFGSPPNPGWLVVPSRQEPDRATGARSSKAPRIAARAAAEGAG